MTSTVSPLEVAPARRARASAAATISSHLGEAALAQPAAGQVAVARLDDAHAARPQGRRGSRCTAGCSNMLTFMAGATSTGARVAR